MAKKSKLAVDLEYAALRTACGVVNMVPYPLAMRLADVLAVVAVRVFRFKCSRTMARLASVFPSADVRTRRSIAEHSLANILRIGVEMMRSSRLTSEWMDRHVAGGRDCRDRLQALLDEGKGAVVMVPHSGNWYMAAWAMAKYGLPLFAIAARQRNPKIDAWMRRQYGDIEVLERGSARTLVEVARKLASGRAFAILPDLRVPQPDVEVDFLGGRANVSHAGAMFAVRTGCPIVVATARREGGRHVLEWLGVLRPDPSADRRSESVRLTREALKLIDGSVRRHPGDWYWYNKRWILQPVAK